MADKKRVPIYDISGPEPVLGEIDEAELEPALASGQFAVPQKAPIPVLSPDGTEGTVDGAELQQALQSGFKLISEQQRKELTYGTAGQQALTALEGAASAATFGLSEAAMAGIESAFPDSPLSAEDRLARREVNPVSSMVGQVGGLLTPGGAGAAAAKLGTGIAAKAGFGTVGTLATKAAIENAVMASGDEVAKAFLKDPKQTLDNALINVGAAAVIGGGFGGAIGGAGKLAQAWSEGPGKAMGKYLDAVKSRANGIPKEELAMLGLDDVKPELLAALSDDVKAKNMFETLRNSNTSAGDSIKAIKDGFLEQLKETTAKVVGKTPDELVVSAADAGRKMQKVLSDKIDEIYTPVKKAYSALEDKFAGHSIPMAARQNMDQKLAQYVVDSGLLKSGDDAAIKFLETRKAALRSSANVKDLKLFAQNLNKVSFTDPNFRVAKDMRRIVLEGMDEALGDAAGAAGMFDEFQKTQAAYANVRGTIDDVNSYVRAGKVRGVESYLDNMRDLDPETIASRLISEKTEMRKILQDNFPEALELAKQYKRDLILDQVKDGSGFSIKKLIKKLDGLEPETRDFLFTPDEMKKLAAIDSLEKALPKNANPSGTAAMLDRLFGREATTAVGIAGSLVGGLGTGIPAALAMFGIKEGAAGGKLAMLRYLGSEAPTNADAFRAAVNLAEAHSKGAQLVDKAVKSIFKEAEMPQIKANTEQLKKLVDEMVTQPDAQDRLLSIGDRVGYYNPEVAQEMGAKSIRVLTYLANKRPNSAPLSPLDAPRAVAEYEESEYNRALAIAEQPLIVLKAVKEGKLVPSDLEHLGAMHPEFGQFIRSKLQQEMIESIADGYKPDYSTVMALSMFLGQPLESSLQPEAIQANQSHVKPQQLMPTSMPKTRKSNTLPKLAPVYMTPGQSRQKDRLDN